jgi:PKD repeat protein
MSMPSVGQRAGQSRRGRRGQALVEFALMLPVVLFLTLMAIDLGRVFLAAVTLNNTARVGARYAATNPASTWDQATYLSQIANEWADIDCDKQSPVPNPIYSGTRQIGEPVSVALNCTFHVLTPLISDVIGTSLVLHAEAIIPVTSCEGTDATTNPICIVPPSAPLITPVPTATTNLCNGVPILDAVPLSQTALAGVSVDYTITYTNNDNVACAARSVTLSTAFLLSGWTATFSPSSFIVAPGTSSSATLTVTSSSTASGSYSITVNATGAAGIAVHYTVLACGQAPVLAAGPTPQQGAPGLKRTYTATVTNNDPIGCLDRQFTFTMTRPNGWGASTVTTPAPITVAASTNGSTTFDVTPPSGALGSYDITISTSGVNATVQYVIQPCTQNTPSWSVGPITQTGALNIHRTYTVTVTNNDSISCGPRAFTPTVTHQATSNAAKNRWSQSVNAAIPLAPGASGSSTFEIWPNSSQAVTVNPCALGSAHEGCFDVTIPGPGTLTKQVQYVVSSGACTPAAPTVTASPATQIGAPGATKTYTVSVTNNDVGAACASRTFTFSVTSSPAGWTVGTFNPVSLTLGPGSAGSSDFTVTPPGGAAPGTYTITVATSQGGSPSVSYVIPVVPTPTPGPTASPTPGPTASPTPAPTASPTPGPTASPTPGPTASPTPAPTASPTPAPTASPTEAPPVANFSGTPTSGTAPFTVTFTDSSSGTITSWAWTFGDGGSSSAQNPTHDYTTAPFTYDVSLTVTGPGGSDTMTKLGYITVN